MTPVSSSLCQTPDDFNPGANNYVYGMAVQADGKILFYGKFSVLGQETHVAIGRVHADGLADNSFKASADWTVAAAAVQKDGKIVLAGEFTVMNGLGRSRIARLHPDGTLDLTFNPNANGTVWGLAVQDNGQILVGGDFTRLANQPRARIARLNEDGSLDLDFNPGADGGVYCYSLLESGQALVGGNFSTIGGQTRKRAARLNRDGSVDSTFPDLEIVGYVNCFAQQSDGQLLLGGSLYSVRGVTRGNIARLKANAMVDTDFKASYGSTVESIIIQANGKPLVAGLDLFAPVRRYNPDGTLDPSFGGVGNLGSSVYGMALQPDGRILIGGSFSRIKGQDRKSIARLINPDPATESVTFDGTNLTWLRGGGGPEINRTSIEFSTDSTNWISLGSMERITGGWRSADLRFPPKTALRMRGFADGAMHHAGTWYIERLLTESPPVVHLETPRLDAMTSSFAFSVSGATGHVMVIEESRDLATWIPVLTNLVTGASLTFQHQLETNRPSGFYRARAERP